VRRSEPKASDTSSKRQKAVTATRTIVCIVMILGLPHLASYPTIDIMRYARAVLQWHENIRDCSTRKSENVINRRIMTVCLLHVELWFQEWPQARLSPNSRTMLSPEFHR